MSKNIAHPFVPPPSHHPRPPKNRPPPVLSPVMITHHRGHPATQVTHPHPRASEDARGICRDSQQVTGKLPDQALLARSPPPGEAGGLVEEVCRRPSEGGGKPVGSKAKLSLSRFSGWKSGKLAEKSGAPVQGGWDPAFCRFVDLKPMRVSNSGLWNQSSWIWSPNPIRTCTPSKQGDMMADPKFHFGFVRVRHHD